LSSHQLDEIAAHRLRQLEQHLAHVLVVHLRPDRGARLRRQAFQNMSDVRGVEFGQNATHRRSISGLERGQHPLQVIRFLGFARLGHGVYLFFAARV